MKIELSQTFQVLADTGPTGPSRTIQGVAVPYNTDANASTGPVRFLPGSLPTDGPAPKLLMHHDSTLPVGLVTERVDTPDAMLFSARISDTVAGNEALTLALDGVIDGVSVGIIATDFTFEDGVLVVSAADWRELSMTPFPAFSAAAITDVAAELADDPVDVPTDDDTTSSDTSQEETTMADVEAQAPIQSAPIILGGALTKPRVTASEYVVAMLTGNKSVLAADNALAEIPGLLPEPLIGEVWNTQFSGRPIIDAVGARALPQYGETFNRRYISQHTAVGTQANEFDNLASQQFEVSKLLFTKVTKGGYLNVSAQSGDWSDPALVQQIINDMVQQYSIQTENYVGNIIGNASISATTTITDATDGDEVIAALYDGAAEMRDGVGVLPTHLMVSTSVWAKFGQAKDSGGNRIFPYLGPTNAAGTANGATSLIMNPLGLNLVVTNDLGAGDQAMLVYGPAVEVYEDRSRTGGIRVENPATASATIGLWGYIAGNVIPAGVNSYVLYMI